MQRRSLAVLIAAAFALPVAVEGQSAQAAPAAPAASTITQPPADPRDVESIDAIVGALYDVISGPAGHKRNWDRMRSLFVPGAKLIPVRVPRDSAASPVFLDVEGYIQRSGPLLERNGFFEREIGRRTETFGHIAHVFSTYESKRTEADAQPFARGINSIQLLNDGNRWWVVNVYWDSERPGQPIPPQYIGRH